MHRISLFSIYVSNFKGQIVKSYLDRHKSTAVEGMARRVGVLHHLKENALITWQSLINHVGTFHNKRRKWALRFRWSTTWKHFRSHQLLVHTSRTAHLHKSWNKYQQIIITMYNKIQIWSSKIKFSLLFFMVIV